MSYGVLTTPAQSAEQVWPTWMVFTNKLRRTATYGADLSNNAGRKGHIRSWAAGFASNGRAQAQFARSTKEFRVALVDAVAAVCDLMKETPADQPLILPTWNDLAMSATDLMSDRAVNRIHAAAEHGHHHPRCYSPSHQVAPATEHPLPPRVYYHPGTYPGNPVPLTEPPPTGPPPRAYPNAPRLDFNSGFAQPPSGESLYATAPPTRGPHDLASIGRRAAFHYRTTPEEWARRNAW